MVLSTQNRGAIYRYLEANARMFRALSVSELGGRVAEVRQPERLGRVDAALEPVRDRLDDRAYRQLRGIVGLLASFDAFVFVTPEYNHGVPGALKNAIDFLFKEWNNKAAGFVSYGSAGGTRAVEHLRLVMAELQVADVRSQVALSLFTDFENFSTFKPQALHQNSLKTMFDQLLAWSGAMKAVRTGASDEPASRPARTQAKVGA